MTKRVKRVGKDGEVRSQSYASWYYGHGAGKNSAKPGQQRRPTEEEVERREKGK